MTYRDELEKKIKFLDRREGEEIEHLYASKELEAYDKGFSDALKEVEKEEKTKLVKEKAQ